MRALKGHRVLLGEEDAESERDSALSGSEHGGAMWQGMQVAFSS